MNTHKRVTCRRALRCGRRGFLALAAGAATVALTGPRAEAKALRRQIEADAGQAERLAWLVRYETSAATRAYGLPEGFCVAYTRNRGHHLWLTREREGAPVTGGILWVPEHYTEAHVRACVGYYARQGRLLG